MAATGSDMAEESIFTWGAPPLKFGPGAVDEIGFEMAQHGARRVLILTDPRVNEQQRLLATCARPVTEEDIAGIFAASVQNW